MGISGERVAGKSKKNPLDALMSLPGVGKVTAEKLSKAGMKSPAGIARAGEKGLLKAGLSSGRAKAILAALPKKKAAPKTKAAAKKVAPKKKAAAKKVAPKKRDDGRKGRDLKAPTLAEMLRRMKER